MQTIDRSFHADFSLEVLFSVGERVQVELEEIPEEERNCTTGVIVACTTRFALTPSKRRIVYEVRFDGDKNYAKTTLVCGIKSGTQFSQSRLRKLDATKRNNDDRKIAGTTDT